MKINIKRNEIIDSVGLIPFREWFYGTWRDVNGIWLYDDRIMYNPGTDTIFTDVKLTDSISNFKRVRLRYTVGVDVVAGRCTIPGISESFVCNIDNGFFGIYHRISAKHVLCMNQSRIIPIRPEADEFMNVIPADLNIEVTIL